MRFRLPRTASHTGRSVSSRAVCSSESYYRSKAAQPTREVFTFSIGTQTQPNYLKWMLALKDVEMRE